MTKTFIGVLLLVAFAAQAGQVRGYTRKDGTYVAPYSRSAPDSSRSNNYGSRSNGGSQRDEYSSPGATNRRNPSYGSDDNDNDGISNAFDPKPESKCNNAYGC